MKRFTGYWGQQRLSAKLPWRWDRQGQHAVAGFLLTLLMFGSALFIPPVIAGLWLLALTYAFIQYEVTETEDINDWAWPDIKGWMIGTVLAVVPGSAIYYYAERYLTTA